MAHEIEILLVEDEGLFILHGEYRGFYDCKTQGFSY